MKKMMLLLGLLSVVFPAFGKTNNLHSVEEVSIPWKDHGLENPFTDAELRLKITAPENREGGSEFTFFGFYDGNGEGGQNGDVWKYRICLDAPGEWIVQPIFVNPVTGNPLANAPQIPPHQIKVGTAEQHHGHIQVDPEGGLRYVHADGTPFFPFPFHASGLLDNDPAWVFPYIDEHLKRGIDNLTVRFHADGKNPNLPPRYQWLLRDGSSGKSWPSSADAFDYSRFDLATWHCNEQFIQYALDKGMHLSIWFGISGINRQYQSYGSLDNNGGELGPQQIQFIKYILARWGAYPNWWHWTINSEWEESKKRELNVAYAKKIKELMPWPLLITNHSLRDWTLGGAEEGWDLVQLQRRVINTDAGATGCRNFITANDRFGLPVFNIEGVWNLQSGTHSRIATIAQFMEGGTSLVAFDGKGTSSSWACNWPDLQQGQIDAAAAIGSFAQLLYSSSWKNRLNSALPAHDLVTLAGGHIAMCNARPGDAYFVWCDEGGTPTLDLTAETGAFSILRYDLNQPDKPPTESKTIGGKKVALPAGDTTRFGNDWFYAVLKDQPDNTPRIITRELKPAFAGKPYVAPLRISNAQGPVAWRIEKGTLPQGLRLEGSRIIGVPRQTGSAEFTLSATGIFQSLDPSVAREAPPRKRWGNDRREWQKTFRLDVGEQDEQPPTVSEINAADFSDQGFTLSWKTDEPATSRAQWGPNPGNLEGESGEIPELVTEHAVFIPGTFRSGETVHVLIVTTDAANNTRSKKDTVIFP